MTIINSLEALKAALDVEFKPYVLELSATESLTLKQLMRVDEKPRNEALSALEVIKKNQAEEGSTKEQTPEDIAALGAAVTTVLRCVVADGKGDRLVEALDGDLLLSMKVLEAWSGATQAPEATSSST